jgi:protease-4
MFPTVEKPLAKYLGIHTDGVGTTRWSDALRPDRPLDPALADVAQQAIDHGYEEFLSHVGQARRMTRDQVDKIARGRIWSGEDAKRLGLVDQLGGLEAALDSAARRAKLGKGYRVYYVETEKTLRQRVLGWLADAALPLADAAGGAAARPRGFAGSPSLAARLDELRDQLSRLSRWNDPRGLYAHCLCGED